MDVFFVGRIGLCLFWFGLAGLNTSFEFTVSWENFLATDKIKIGEIFRFISWLTVFNKVFGLCVWILRWIRLFLDGFCIDLADKVFEVTVDIYFAPFGRIWFCGDSSRLLLTQKRFRLNISTDLHKILFGLVMGLLKTEFLFEVFNNLVFCLELGFKLSNSGFHFVSIAFDLLKYKVETLGEFLIDFEGVCRFGQLIHQCEVYYKFVN